MSKSLKYILISVLASLIAFCLYACGAQEEIIEEQFSETEIRVEVGYDFEIPSAILNKAKSIKITDKNGNEKKLNGTTVFFDKVGEYVLNFDGNSVDIIVLDSEKPTIYSVGNAWKDLVAATITYGDDLDLDDVFIPIDNSGSANLTYRVFEMGNEVELADGNVLHCNIKNPAYYAVEIYATDGYGNSACYNYRINTSKWYDPALGQRGFNGVCDGANYLLGNFAIADTDLPNGTPVYVSTEIQMYGPLVTKGSLWLRYTPRDGADKKALIQPWNSDKYAEWTKISFVTLVEDGKINLEVRTNNLTYGDGTVEVQRTTIESVTDAQVFEAVGASRKYNLGEFVVAETDIADGEYVEVTAQLKMGGEMFENHALWLRKLDEIGAGDNSDTWGTLVNPYASTSGPYAEWKEIKFNCVVKEGKIILEVRSSTDAAVNAIVMVKSVNVEKSARTYSGTSAKNQYDLGNFVIGKTDAAAGTFVTVTMQLKINGSLAEGPKLWTRYLSGDNKWTQLTAPSTAINASYSDWKEITFTAYVPENQQIAINVRNNTGDSGDYSVSVKDVVIVSAE